MEPKNGRSPEKCWSLLENKDCVFVTLFLSLSPTPYPYAPALSIRRVPWVPWGNSHWMSAYWSEWRDWPHGASEREGWACVCVYAGRGRALGGFYIKPQQCSLWWKVSNPRLGVYTCGSDGVASERDTPPQVSESHLGLIFECWWVYWSGNKLGEKSLWSCPQTQPS